MESQPDKHKPFPFKLIHDDYNAILSLPVNKDLCYFALHSAYVAFTNGSKIVSGSFFTRWFTKAVIYLKGQYTHSELAFKFVSIDSKYEIIAACEIRAGQELQWKWKTRNYYSEIWELRKLAIDEQKCHQLFTDCMRDVKKGIGFNRFVYVNFFLPDWLKRDRRLHAAWCSEHVSARLKGIALPGFENVKPYAMDPLELYNTAIRILELTVHPLTISEVLKKGLDPL